MKQLLFAFTLLCGMSLAACAQGQNNRTMKKSSNVLVAYFSATGTTARAAQTLARVTGGELFAIVPQEAYTGADLDWHDKQSRSSVEMNDPKARPALKGKKEGMDGYDVVFIGYPIWWDAAPRIINTFIESHGLKGKRLIPFATSGGSGIAQSVKALRKQYPDLKWEDGRLLNRAGEADVRRWAEQLGL